MASDWTQQLLLYRCVQLAVAAAAAARACRCCSAQGGHSCRPQRGSRAGLPWPWRWLVEGKGAGTAASAARAQRVGPLSPNFSSGVEQRRGHRRIAAGRPLRARRVPRLRCLLERVQAQLRLLSLLGLLRLLRLLQRLLWLCLPRLQVAEGRQRGLGADGSNLPPCFLRSTPCRPLLRRRLRLLFQRRWFPGCQAAEQS